MLECALLSATVADVDNLMYFLLYCHSRAVNAEQIDTYQLKSLDGQFGE